MSFLDRLLGRRPDPTQDWPPSSMLPPGFDLTRRAFGSLTFGTDLDSARFLGRPTSLEWLQHDYCTLLYARGGFQLDFDAGKFIGVSFFIGPDPYLPSHPEMTFSRPYLNDTIQLTPDTRSHLLSPLLCSPDLQDTDEDETIMSYTQNGITIEFEYELGGALKRCNLFPK